MSTTRIRIVQRGGFAGTTEQVDVDGGRLVEAEADEVETACAELIALQDAPGMAEPEVGADIPSYLVEIEQGGDVRRFELPETAGQEPSFAGPAVGAILARLRRLSRD